MHHESRVVDPRTKVLSTVRAVLGFEEAAPDVGGATADFGVGVGAAGAVVGPGVVDDFALALLDMIRSVRCVLPVTVFRAPSEIGLSGPMRVVQTRSARDLWCVSVCVKISLLFP
jgi:hypothetical protein